MKRFVAKITILFLLSPLVAAQALEIQDGHIRFAEDSRFYENMPETLFAALSNPKVKVGSKESMILRMVRDKDLPATQYNVLFNPALHSERSLTLALMRTLVYYRPHDVSRLSSFPFAIETAIEQLVGPDEKSQNREIIRSQLLQLQVHVGFLDQILTWVEPLDPADFERANDLRKYGIAYFIQDAGLYAFPQRNLARKSDSKRAGYDFFSCGVRLVKMLMRMEARDEARDTLAQIVSAMPLPSYEESAPDYVSEYGALRSEIEILSRQLERGGASPLTVVTAPVTPVVEATRPSEPIRPSEKEQALLTALATRDTFALITALEALQEGDGVSAAAAVALHGFIVDSSVEMSEPLRQMAQQFVRPQLSRHLENLVTGIWQSPEGKALMRACSAALLYQ